MDLQLAATPLYVTVALLTAVAAIISSDIRDGKSLDLKPRRNLPALALLMAALINISHIVLAVLVKNDWNKLSGWGYADLILHTLVLLFLLAVACLWYRSIVTFEKRQQLCQLLQVLATHELDGGSMGRTGFYRISILGHRME